jgi:GH15 family glucan-1,4-alpha-glucosidase
MKLEDYAMLGDGQTAALVGQDGSIDWLCWPRFDSAACFARLLGTEQNGRWLLAPARPGLTSRRAYRHNTLILETFYESDEGAACVIDFMPNTRPDCFLMRIVQGLRGSLDFTTELILRPNYGVAIPWVRRLDDDTLLAVVGPDAITLRTAVRLEPEGRVHRGTFTVGAGETRDFTLGYHLSFQEPPAPIAPQQALARTLTAWHGWTKHFERETDYPELVMRSLITLRALIYEPSGAIVAAPTTSLPEEIGGSRNWDYRYCWLRDATYTLLALTNGGFHREAANWRRWLLRAVGGDARQIQIMYGIGGEQRLPEDSLDLPGYEGSRPVRVGNAASQQLQLDIFGEVLDALFQARKFGVADDDDDWSVQIELLKHLEQVWTEKDEGIWEVRGGRQHFVFSKMMAWVAFDRAVKTVEHFGLPGPVDHWRRLRDEIHADVCAKGWSETAHAFTQSYGTDRLDASVLLMPMTGFLPASDPRIVSTVAAIEKHLMRDGFVRRYIPEGQDGLTGDEGAFLACSFWFVDNLVMQGRRAEARAMFERLTAIVTDLGFLSEEYDVRNKRLVGNFPQAFSHIALINSAFNLYDGHAPCEQRSGHAAPKTSQA